MCLAIKSSTMKEDSCELNTEVINCVGTDWGSL
jgi:hypothetical protein